MRWIGIAWNLAAIFFIASVFAAPFVLFVQRCRARGKRLFRDQPTARVRALHHSPTDHTMDGFS